MVKTIWSGPLFVQNWKFFQGIIIFKKQSLYCRCLSCDKLRKILVALRPVLFPNQSTCFNVAAVPTVVDALAAAVQKNRGCYCTSFPLQNPNVTVTTASQYPHKAIKVPGKISAFPLHPGEKNVGQLGGIPIG